MKKDKQAQKQEEASHEAKNIVPLASPLVSYPETTETRTLKVILPDKEKNEASMESARLVREISAIEDQKKASASSYKARIEEKQARQNYLAGLVIEGWEERSVKCRWCFECSGIDVNGREIYHPNQKALIRCDTNEVVEVVAMTEADFESKELALGGDNQSAETDSKEAETPTDEGLAE